MFVAALSSMLLLAQMAGVNSVHGPFAEWFSDSNFPPHPYPLQIEGHLRMAEQAMSCFRSYTSFQHREDLACIEFLVASIIARRRIPNHRDFPRLDSDRGSMRSRYMELLAVRSVEKSGHALHQSTFVANCGTTFTLLVY